MASLCRWSANACICSMVLRTEIVVRHGLCEVGGILASATGWLDHSLEPKPMGSEHAAKFLKL
eukprot:2273022-Karenia_brevis.AAC.1